MSYSLYLFDLDGTLVDSLPDLRDSINYVATKLDESQRFELDQVATFVGSGVSHMLRSAFPHRADHLRDLRAIFDEYYEDNCARHTAPYDGILETMDQLRQRDRDLGVVTNKPERFSRQILRQLHMDDFFCLTIGGDTYRERKPHPQPIVEALRTANRAASEAIMIGDSLNDLLSAERTGIDCAYVHWGYGKPDDLQRSQPRYQLREPNEILHL